MTMHLSRLSPLTAIGGILLIVAVAMSIRTWSTSENVGDLGTPKPNSTRNDSTAASTTIKSNPINNPQQEANILLDQLSAAKKNGGHVPEDLKLSASKLAESKRVSFPKRIALIVSALNEQDAALRLRILFKEEIADRPFQNIVAFYQLVPEGTLQFDVADAIGQVVRIAPSESTMALEWLSTMPDDARRRTISLINGRLIETNDIETLKELRKNSQTEQFTRSFDWAIQEIEKKRNQNNQ